LPDALRFERLRFACSNLRDLSRCDEIEQFGRLKRKHRAVTIVRSRTQRWVRDALALTAAMATCVVTAQDTPAPNSVETVPFLRIETGTHAEPVRRIAVHEQRGIIVTVSDDKTGRVWDLANGQPIRVLRPPIGAGEVGRLYGVAIHPSQPLVAIGGTTGATAGHRIYLFEYDTGRLVRSFDARAGDIKRLAWSNDGTLLLAGYAGSNGLRAFDTGGRVVFEQATRGGVYGIAVARAGGRVAATDFAGQIIVLEARAGAVALVNTLRSPGAGPVSLAFSPDGERLVIGHFEEDTLPTVIDVASGRVLQRLTPSRSPSGVHMTVEWARDGREILIAGRGSIGLRRYPVWRFDAQSGRELATVDLATDSILDLAPLADGRVAYASFDGSWGVFEGTQPRTRVEAARGDLRGPEHLAISADARMAGWAFDFGSDRAFFDFARRVVDRGSFEGATGARLRRGFFDTPLEFGTGAAKRRTAKINGRDIPLGQGELAAAATYLPGNGDAILGTTWALYRIGESGGVAWRIATGSEVCAVAASADARLLVTAMADGTLRWWRSQDGRLLLTLFPIRDGRWVAWTPEGYFDTSVGADQLVGWVVNEDAEHAAVFHTLGRFRERFHRPDVIDRVLSDGGKQAAITATAPASAQLGTPEPAVATSSPVLLPPPQAPTPLEFPPALAPLGPTRLSAPNELVQLSFEIRSSNPSRPELEVRVNGRPLEAVRIEIADRPDGTRQGTASVRLPPGAATLQLLAKDARGYSDPLIYNVDVRAAVPAPPPRAKPRLFVLAVGVSDYERTEYRLGLAAKDANDFAAAMLAQKDRRYADVTARVLTDRTATRAAVIEGLQWLASAVGPADVGMLFLAGHGVNVPGGPYVFLGADAQTERLTETAVEEHHIRDALRRIRGKAVFFVDTCYSGNTVGDPRTGSRELARLANDLASTENGVVVFASSSGRQQSVENDAWGNGAFTRAIVDGLKGRADITQTGRVTFKALDFFVSEEVRRLTRGRQTPVTIMPVGVPDFDLAQL
jgi:WD40 repeat protein